MAKQSGIIKLDGTLAGLPSQISGRLSCKGKRHVSAERIATDPNFQRTRENGEEFGRAGKTPMKTKADDPLSPLHRLI